MPVASIIPVPLPFPRTLTSPSTYNVGLIVSPAPGLALLIWTGNFGVAVLIPTKPEWNEAPEEYSLGPLTVNMVLPVPTLNSCTTVVIPVNLPSSAAIPCPFTSRVVVGIVEPIPTLSRSEEAKIRSSFTSNPF